MEKVTRSLHRFVNISYIRGDGAVQLVTESCYIAIFK